MRTRCLTVQDGHLHMDGHDVAALGRRLPTPFFLYSESQVRWNIERLRNAFTRRHLDTEVFFASKACSNLWFLELVRRTGINVEVNSGGELWKALKAGFDPSQIGFNGAGKTRAEIAQAVAAGIRAIVVDSVFELETIAEAAAGAGTSANVSLRVDVDVATSTHPGLSTTHGGKAGIDLDDAPAAFRFAAGHEHLALRGLHLHIGSQIVETAPYVLAVARALDVI
jgi:diaminopimelate decarboxylase